MNSALTMSSRLIALCAALLLGHASIGVAQAKPDCLDFRAVALGTLPSPHQLLPEDTWGFDIWGVLGGQVVSGYTTGNDGDVRWHGVGATAKNGFHYVVLKDMAGGDLGSFWIQLHSQFGFPPGKAGLGDYKGIGVIVEGKGQGKFAYASGNFEWAGPYVVWEDAASPFGVSGRASVELRSMICGVTD